MKGKLVLKIKKIIYYYFNLFNYREKKAIESVIDITSKQEQQFQDSKFTVGILKEKWHLHSNFIKACNELKVSYQVIDFFSKDGLEDLKAAPIDVLIARPSVQYTPWKDMFDNRLKLLKDNGTVPVFPNFNALWIWESKLRTIDFLKLNNLPHPKSYIFYDMQEVFNFASSYTYPLVYKASSGSGASGVKILNSASQLKSITKKVFGKGVRSYRKHKLDKEHGFIILQDYIRDVKEWRIIRIGDYYFGFEKLKNGEFHSGSQNFGYGMPPIECLELVKNITETHLFKFVSIDIFISSENEYFINEIQPYFGQKDDRELLVVKGKPGRLSYNQTNNSWDFEEGMFCKNNLCNLRLQQILKIIDN
ncbi:ATP-grasp domain-containing protein [Winogradskyella pulchriflava]|uniref:RimK family alpha-L-glutamate ligase n=1 Tax=Winogradskyella pulchriflava TaxID=1110688 RepID=A0ABV6Q726_9FLAO